MSVLQRIAHFQNRRDEVPNQELARDLAARRDLDGICEIAENLRNKNKGIQADCLKVLCEIDIAKRHIVQEGKELGQGIGYLEDGTMVVVEGGRKYLNQTIPTVVTKILQTSAGRMIFARPDNSGK